MSKEREPRPAKLTLERITALATETALRRGGHPPMLFVEGSHESVAITIEQLEATHEGRLEQMRAAGWMAGSRGAVGVLEQVFLVTEAWLSSPDGDKPPIIPPSADPKRKEIMIISLLNLEQARADLRILEMIRDQHDTLQELKPYLVPQEAGMSFDMPLLRGFVEGYMVGLMSPPHHDDA